MMQGVNFDFLNTPGTGANNGATPYQTIQRPNPYNTGAAKLAPYGTTQPTQQTSPYSFPTPTTSYNTPVTQTPSDVDQYTQNITLTPGQQQIFDRQQANSLGQGDLVAKAGANAGTAISNPYSSSNINGLTSYGTFDPTGASDASRGIADALYKSQTNYLQPYFGQQEETERSRLLASGFSDGSEGYTRGIRDLRNTQNQSLQQAANNATTGALNAQYTGANFNNATRQQQISEALQNRNQNINEFTTLNSQTSPVQIPSGGQGGGAAAGQTDLSSLYKDAATGQINLGNANAAQGNSNLDNTASLVNFLYNIYKGR